MHNAINYSKEKFTYMFPAQYACAKIPRKNDATSCKQYFRSSEDKTIITHIHSFTYVRRRKWRQTFESNKEYVIVHIIPHMIQHNYHKCGDKDYYKTNSKEYKTKVN